MDKKKGLGRGLESLFAFYDNEQVEEIATKKTPIVESKSVDELNINDITPNPNQPRKHFDQDALQELADSIKVHGVIQPLVVNKLENGKYMIIAGERRWRASKLAGLDKVPVVIKNYSDKQVKEISIIENLQREDLNPIEAAISIEQMLKLMPKDVMVMGNIDPVSLKDASKEDVIAATNALLEAIGDVDNFVISSGCDIPPFAKWENIDAFMKTAQEYYQK